MSKRLTENIVINNGSVFKLGELFNTYEDVMERLAIHCKQSFVHYWRRDSRTVKSMRKRLIRPIDKRLLYFYVKFACVYGGQKYTTKGKGYRLYTTMRENCPAHITVRVNKDGKKLEVTSVLNTHNHPISKEIYEKLRQDRQLSPDLKSEVVDLLTIGVDKSLINKYINILSGKCLKRKDILNIGGSIKKPFESLTHQRIRELMKKFDDVVIEGYVLEHNDNLLALNCILYNTSEDSRKTSNKSNLKVLPPKTINKKHLKESILDCSEVKNDYLSNEEIISEDVTIDPEYKDLLIDFDSNVMIDNEITIYDSEIDIIDENMEPVNLLDNTLPQNSDDTNDPIIAEQYEGLNDIFTETDNNEYHEIIYCDNQDINNDSIEIIENKVDDPLILNYNNISNNCNNNILSNEATEKNSELDAVKCSNKKSIKTEKSINNEDKCPTCGRFNNGTEESIEELLKEREQLYKESATLYLQCEKLKRDLILERRNKKNIPNISSKKRKSK